MSWALWLVKEVILKKYLPHDSVYMTFWKKQNCSDREQIRVVMN